MKEEKQVKIVEAREGEIFDIELEESLLKKNEELARGNRERLDAHGVMAIDVMGSIGAGKTSLIGGLVARLGGRRVRVIAGDLTTTIDADRLRAAGAEVVQVNTGKECHLDARLVERALDEMDLEATDLLFIENVGNLICPGEFPLGAHRRMVVVSVTEGPYTVVKHPYIFLDADLVVINKVDLAEAMRVDPQELARQVATIKPGLQVVYTNCITGQGLEQVVQALGMGA
jgi:hydrogenase nickel incorporation protein HypB